MRARVASCSRASASLGAFFGGFPFGGDTDLVLELENDPLSGFFSDAADFGNRRDVARDDGSLEHLDRQAAQDGERDLWPDPCDMVQQKAEEVALTGREEPVEDMRILADGEVRQDFHGSPRLGKPLIA